MDAPGRGYGTGMTWLVLIPLVLGAALLLPFAMARLEPEERSKDHALAQRTPPR